MSFPINSFEKFLEYLRWFLSKKKNFSKEIHQILNFDKRIQFNWFCIIKEKKMLLWPWINLNPFTLCTNRFVRKSTLLNTLKLTWILHAALLKYFIINWCIGKNYDGKRSNIHNDHTENIVNNLKVIQSYNLTYQIFWLSYSHLLDSTVNQMTRIVCNLPVSDVVQDEI